MWDDRNRVKTLLQVYITEQIFTTMYCGKKQMKELIRGDGAKKEEEWFDKPSSRTSF